MKKVYQAQKNSVHTDKQPQLLVENRKLSLRKNVSHNLSELSRTLVSANFTHSLQKNSDVTGIKKEVLFFIGWTHSNDDSTVLFYNVSLKRLYLVSSRLLSLSQAWKFL